MATRMSELKISEISGVDSPANTTPGWIVRKSADWRQEVEKFEKSVCGLFDGLKSSDADLYFDGADEDVAKARQTLIDHISKDVEEDKTEDAAAEAEAEEESETTKSLGQRLKEAIVGEPAEKAKKKGGKAEDEEDGEDDESEEDDVEGEGDKPKFGTKAYREKYKKAREDAAELGIELPEEPADPNAEAETEDEGDGEEAETSEDPDAEAETEAEPEVEQIDVEALTKSIGESIAEQVDNALQKHVEPLTDAVDAVVGRIDGVERHLAGTTALQGQEDFEGEEPSGLSKAIHGALVNGRAELT